MEEGFIKEFIAQALYRIDENTKKVTACLNEIEEAEVWRRPNENLNSVGNLILHLCGNIRQYAVSSLGNRKDDRDRDKEFSAHGGHSRSELIQRLSTTIEEAKNIIQRINPEELLREKQEQGYTFSGIDIIIHFIEHYSYHTGQIIFWTKFLRNKDLGFYSGVDLNAKNEI